MQDSTAVKIQVEVLNGCGVSGVAEKLTDYLRTNNIDVVNLGNYRSFEIENSIIIGRNEKIHNAEIVAAIVGLDEAKHNSANQSRLFTRCYIHSR
ncbi:MAG: LytR C-terminal domain-containing protein [Ignavibacteriaceae bacterium]|nr:LytR C-terminal domain-containing protein [Ignavibacteriaceae bacterium]